MRTAAEARRLGRPRIESQALYGAGVCRLLQLRYRDALEFYLAAREAARGAGDPASIAMLSAALSVLYVQQGQHEAAEAEARRAYSILGRGIEQEKFYPHLLLNLGMLKAKRGEDGAAPLFRAAADAGLSVADPDLTPNALSHLGLHYLGRGKTDEAEPPLVESFRLRKTLNSPHICLAFMQLGMLRRAQGRLDESLRLLSEAVGCATSRGSAVSPAAFYRERGALHAAAGRLEAALSDYRAAADWVRRWRLGVLAADAVQVGVESALLSGLYEDYSRTALRAWFAAGRRELLAEGFEALEEGRAASLRVRAGAAASVRLPAGYWPKLKELRNLELASLRGSADVAGSAPLRLELLEMEMRAGLTFRVSQERAWDAAGLRAALEPGEALLSFALFDRMPVLFAVTREGMEVHRLPPEAAAPEPIASYRELLVRDPRAARPAGHTLYTRLFGQLSASVLAKDLWTLSVEGPLLTLPFAALTVLPEPMAAVYLAERHALRIVPGAYVRGGGTPASRAFLGVGDPVLNPADPRYPRPSWLRRLSLWNRAPAMGLPRLPGSAQEVESCAQASGHPAAILTGRETLPGRLIPELERGPAIAHLATHIVEPRGRPEEAMLALGLNNAGAPQFLSSAEIHSLTAAPAVVAMSACQSGVGKTLPGTGLLGLARSWLLAGSEAAVASHWPTPDDTGELFHAFYRYLASEPGNSSAACARALRRAQIEMVRSGGWRAEPQYFAAFYVYGKN